MANHFCPNCHEKFSEDSIIAVREDGRWYCSHTCKNTYALRELHKAVKESRNANRKVYKLPRSP
jgi:ribosomal protein S27AE